MKFRQVFTERLDVTASVLPHKSDLLMEKVTFPFAALAAIIAITACAGTTGTVGTQCAKPRLTPSDASHAITSVMVTIATATEGAYLRYTLDGSTPTGGTSGNGTEITASSGTVSVEFGLGARGTTLKAIAYKAGLADSLIAVGNYVYESPY
jgi:Chitobiase/beta-hexosaminidase C-terminal domain